MHFFQLCVLPGILFVKDYRCQGDPELHSKFWSRHFRKDHSPSIGKGTILYQSDRVQAFPDLLSKFKPQKVKKSVSFKILRRELSLKLGKGLQKDLVTANKINPLFISS